jgi:hypothetical protein
MVRIEASLLCVEGLGAVDIRDWDRHQFELPIHDPSPLL